MKKALTIVLLCLVLPTAIFAQNITINGAGATFPYPIYAQWGQRNIVGNHIRFTWTLRMSVCMWFLSRRVRTALSLING